jgi:hypothetical protein
MMPSLLMTCAAIGLASGMTLRRPLKSEEARPDGSQTTAL